MATIWRSPPDSEPARWPRRLPSSGKISVTNSSRSLTPLGFWNMPISRFSWMVSDGNTLFVCGTKPTPFDDELVRLEVRDLLAVQLDRALAHLHQSEDGLEQRRLAGAVRADDADELALPCHQGAGVEDVHAGQVAGRDGVDLDDGRRPPARAPRPRRVHCSSSMSSFSTSTCSVSIPRSASWWAPR